MAGTREAGAIASVESALEAHLARVAQVVSEWLRGAPIL